MLLKLDRHGPLYGQVYRALRADILGGRMHPGARVPSTRWLAGELGVSRNITVLAYDQLLAEGYLTARGGAGTFVASELPENLTFARSSDRRDSPPPTPPWPVHFSACATRVLDQSAESGFNWEPRRSPLPYDFRYGRPSFADFPHSTWWRVMARRARRASIRDLDYGAAEGAAPLREALAEYLRRARAVACTPEQIIVVSGSQQALDLAARVLIDPGDRVLLEEPHYRAARGVMRAAGARIETVAVDEQGLCVNELARMRGPFRLMFVTPSHQFPTGALMPLGRRLDLLAWANRMHALVFEDDYDSEYRYAGRPIEALQALDETGCVLYAGTFSKMMFPALRLGYLVVPHRLVSVFRSAKALLDTGCPTLPQLALVDFMREGHFERHLRHSRARNAARREALLTAIHRYFGDRGQVSASDTGLHVLLWLPGIPFHRTSELRRQAERVGVGVYSVGPFFLSTPRHAGLLLGYSSLTEKEISEGIRRLAAVILGSGN